MAAPTNIMRGLVPALASGLAVVTLYLWHAREAERRRAEQLHSRVEVLEQQLSVANGSAARVAAPPVAAPAPLPATATARADESQPPLRSPRPAASLPSADQAISAWQSHERQMLRDPAYRAAKLAEYKLRLAQTRADAIRVVDMSADEADRVIALWAERNLRFFERHDFTRSAQPDSPELAERARADGEAEQAEVRVLLGEKRYADWQRYLASQPIRAEIQQLRAQLSTSGEPLLDDQVDALVDVIHGEQERRDREYQDYLRDTGITDHRGRYLDLERSANRRIHDAAIGRLSTLQIERLDAMLRARLVPLETALRMQRDGKLAKSD
jgi:hypothetical protein